MNAVQFIRLNLEMGAGITLQLLDNMHDAPLTFPTPKGGNHPLWVIGHMAFVEGQIQGMLIGRPNPLAHWAGIFGGGTEPTANPADYPAFEEARSAFMARRADTLQYLETLTDADLDRAVAVPPELQKHIGTVAKLLFVITANTLTHRGQVADSRRAAGRPKLGL